MSNQFIGCFCLGGTLSIHEFQIWLDNYGVLKVCKAFGHNLENPITRNQLVSKSWFELTVRECSLVQKASHLVGSWHPKTTDTRSDRYAFISRMSLCSELILRMRQPLLGVEGGYPAHPVGWTAMKPDNFVGKRKKNIHHTGLSAPFNISLWTGSNPLIPYRPGKEKQEEMTTIYHIDRGDRHNKDRNPAHA